ncbi:MAG: formylglycine-generating enzyme family protein [Polymorphobacter sp.]|uniref:formylglycine-generating enzyme family protein n=1 Tax=Polymorphobacter sp. TaxID=1909290 RepID=UPI003A8AA282
MARLSGVPGYVLAALLLAGCATSKPDAPGDTTAFKDCSDCPELVAIPAGSFAMGRDGGEPDRYDGPVRDIVIEKRFALGRTEVTQAQFRAFVTATGYKPAATCNVYFDGRWGMRDWADWQSPGIGRPPRDDEPVACVSWNDATAYLAWLSDKAGKRYRLPSEAEWEYVARAGTRGTFPWGEDPDLGCREANMFDKSGGTDVSIKWDHADCDDGHVQTSPVGALTANSFGVHDILGNLWEWTQDCYVLPYPADGPRDGSPVEVAGECARRTVRGGSWETRPSRFAVAFRGRDKPDQAFRTFGFRVARDL